MKYAYIHCWNYSKNNPLVNVLENALEEPVICLEWQPNRLYIDNFNQYVKYIKDI